MLYDQKYVAAKLYKWEKYMKEFSLPTWEQLPPIELYMDQVLALLTQYLDFLPKDDNEDKIVSASAINNYVRLKIMPAPLKKRYARVHIAYLIMICTLKQTLNIAYVQKLLPMNLSEEEVRTIYNDYVEKHKATALFFTRQAHSLASGFLSNPEHHEDAVENLVITSAVVAGFAKLLVEKVVKLQNTTLEESTDPQIEQFIPPALKNDEKKA